MSAKSAKWAWVDALQSEHGPRAAIRHLGLCLSTHMENDGSRSFPGTRMIAKEMGVRRQTVLDLVHEAEAQGWLRIEKRRGGRRGGEFNQYFPAIPTEESGAPAAPVTDAEAVRLPHRSESESGAVDDESGAVDGSKAVRLAHLSSSVVTQRVSHGSLPALESASGDVPSGWSPSDDLCDPARLRARMQEPELSATRAALNMGPYTEVTERDVALLLEHPVGRSIQWRISQREAA